MPKSESIDREARLWIITVLDRQMRRMGLSQADVSRRTGVSEGTLSTLLHGQVKGLGLDQVLKLHRGLHISGDLLLGKPDWRSLSLPGPPLAGERAPPIPRPPARRQGSGRQMREARR